MHALSVRYRGPPTEVSVLGSLGGGWASDWPVCSLEVKASDKLLLIRCLNKQGTVCFLKEKSYTEVGRGGSFGKLSSHSWQDECGESQIDARE